MKTAEIKTRTSQQLKDAIAMLESNTGAMHAEGAAAAEVLLAKLRKELVSRIPVDAWGVRGLQNRTWRREFRNAAAFEKWLEKTSGDVTVYGCRDAEQAA